MVRVRKILRDPGPEVLVKDVRIPATEPWIARFARHSWLEMKGENRRRWIRIEILDSSSGVVCAAIDEPLVRSRRRWGRRVRILAAITGDGARGMADRILEAAESFGDPSRYRAWPGPNSNTFVAGLGRRVPGLFFDLDHNAVGKDWVSGIRFGRTTSGTGVALDLPLLGLAIGLVEGLELHLLGLTCGVSLFPPALKVPFLPRLGFRRSKVAYT